MAGRWGDLFSRANGVLDPGNLSLLYLAAIIAKVFHEYSHAFACKRFGKIGGTATEEAARDEWESFRRVLPELPDETTVWPGHDYGCRAASTIALEKAFNPFLLAENFDAFMALKRDWASFKAENGLA